MCIFADKLQNNMRKYEISKEEYRTVYNYYKWEQEIALCSKEEWLRIEVWDLS